MFVLFTLPVTSTTATITVFTIPTASPDIGNDYVECHIGEEGYVISDVWVFTEDSYGNKKLLVPLWY